MHSYCIRPTYCIHTYTHTLHRAHTALSQHANIHIHTQTATVISHRTCVHMLMQHIIHTLCTFTLRTYIHTRIQHVIYILNNRNIHTHTYTVFIMCASQSHQSCARILIRHYAFILHSSNILYTHIHTYIHTLHRAHTALSQHANVHIHTQTASVISHRTCVHMLMQHIIQTQCTLALRTYIHTRIQHVIYVLNNRNIHTHTYTVFIMCASQSHQSCACILIRHYAFILHSSNILNTHIHTYTASCAYCTIATYM